MKPALKDISSTYWWYVFLLSPNKRNQNKKRRWKKLKHCFLWIQLTIYNPKYLLLSYHPETSQKRYRGGQMRTILEKDLRVEAHRRRTVLKTGLIRLVFEISSHKHATSCGKMIFPADWCKNINEKMSTLPFVKIERAAWRYTFSSIAWRSFPPSHKSSANKQRGIHRFRSPRS